MKNLFAHDNSVVQVSLMERADGVIYGTLNYTESTKLIHKIHK